MNTFLISALYFAALQGAPTATVEPVPMELISSAKVALDRRFEGRTDFVIQDVRSDGEVICGFLKPSGNGNGDQAARSRFAFAPLSDGIRVILADSDGQPSPLLDSFCGRDGQKFRGMDLTVIFSAQGTPAPFSIPTP